MLAVSLYLIYLGTQRFLGVSPNVKGWVLVLLCVALAQAVATHVYPSYHARLVLATSLATCMFLSQAWLLWAHATPTFAPRLCIAVSVLMALVQIILKTAVGCACQCRDRRARQGGATPHGALSAVLAGA